MSAIKNISLFIPHVFPNFTQKYVAEAFSDIGDVDRVDFVAKQDRDGKTFNAVYVHFKRWYTNNFTVSTQDQIAKNGSFQFHHDGTEYYWIVLPNTTKKHVPSERKPRIDLGETNSVSVKAVEKTPEKKVKVAICPSAPKKQIHSQNHKVPTGIAPVLLDFSVDKFEEVTSPTGETHLDDEDIANMEVIEEELTAEDAFLVNIDCRYVQSIEQENFHLHGEIAQLRMALINLDQMYQAEKAKVRAFSNVESSVDL